jgi:pyruvate ferredoxin oxidoreductase beta subunit
MPDPRSENLARLGFDGGEPFVGHKACAGCGATVALRLALKVLGPRVFVGIPAGCMSAVAFLYPQMAFGVNAMISTFPGTASLLSGMAAAVKALDLRDTRVVGFAGDGGTADIGLQALSGAIDRGDRIIYICYDNEAYMNTGVQKSGLTPFGAGTTTSPVGAALRGAGAQKKDVFEIIAAHGIAYAATASIGYPHDYMSKVCKAAAVGGTAYIQVYAPCPTGWGSDSDSAGELGRLAVDCGLWPLREFEDGRHRLNRDPKAFTPLAEYFSRQGRFKHLDEAAVRSQERLRDIQWNRLRRRAEADGLSAAAPPNGEAFS